MNPKAQNNIEHLKTYSTRMDSRCCCLISNKIDRIEGQKSEAKDQNRKNLKLNFIFNSKEKKKAI